MNNLARYIIIVVITAVIAFIAWYFINIISYILIAAVLSLVGRPIIQLLNKIKIKERVLPNWIKALTALVFIWFVFIKFFAIFIPLIANEANELSNVDVTPLLEHMEGPLDKLNQLFIDFNVGEGKYSTIQDYFLDKISTVLNISVLSSIFSTLTSIMGDIFIAVFAISFIMFFFLKDEKMFGNGMLLIIPSKHEVPVTNALKSIRKLLMRYFIGICIQVSAIILLVTTLLKISGIEFQRSVVIGLFVGIFNIIPYVGPFIGAIFGIIVASAGYIELETSILIPKVLWLAAIFLSVQLLDNLVFQPLIYGNSVNAHPLEIFLIILIAGSLAGIPGMILAVPSYTIFRVFAREFLNKFKVIKKITEKIPVNNT